MSLYIYLSEKAYEKLQGRVEINTDKDGRHIYVVRNEQAPREVMIPPMLREFVECVSWKTRVGGNGTQLVPGRYRHESAEAVLNQMGGSVFEAQVFGPKLEHVYQLFYMLRNGSIEPFETWERAQETEAQDLPKVETLDGKIKCPNCEAKFQIARTIAGRSVSMRCRKCGTKFIIDATKIAVPQEGDAKSN